MSEKLPPEVFSTINLDDGISLVEAYGVFDLWGYAEVGATVRLQYSTRGGPSTLVELSTSETDEGWGFWFFPIENAGELWGQGEVELRFSQTDAAGNSSAVLVRTVTVDTVVPTVGLSSDKTVLKAGETATITFTLSEPSPEFARWAESFAVIGGVLSAAQRVSAQGSAPVYRAAFTPTPDFEGQASIVVGSGAFSDAAGNFNGDGEELNNVLKLIVNETGLLKPIERVGKTRYFVTESGAGSVVDFDLELAALSLRGEAIEFVGSRDVDTVIVRPGIVLDFSLSGAGADKVCFTGNFSEYRASLRGTVIALVRGSGIYYEKVEVVAAASEVASDQLVFSDGVVNSLALREHLANPAGRPAPIPAAGPASLLTESPAMGTPDWVPPKIKAFAQNPEGSVFAPMKPGTEFTVIGSPGPDKVYVADGTVVDARALGGSGGNAWDQVLFRGAFSDYLAVTGQNEIVFSRTVNLPAGQYVEKVTVAADTGERDDLLTFADGSVLSKTAFDAIVAQPPSGGLEGIAGWDPWTKTPL